MRVHLLLAFISLSASLGCEAPVRQHERHTQATRDRAAPGPFSGTNRGAPQSLPRTLAALDGPTDAATGLPLRVLHAPSGVILRLIPAGEFLMGRAGESGQERQHRRVIRRPFYMGETEVTVAQFRAFVDATGYITDAERGVPEEPDKTVGAFAQIPIFHQRHWSADAQWRNPFPLLPGQALREDHPVSQASWDDAMAFCKHFGFALPSEAQWEYAARANGTFGGGNFADASTGRVFNEDFGTLEDGYPTHAPVASFAPNGFGLYDLLGNVEEWTANSSFIPDPKDGEDESPVASTRPAAEDDRSTALRGSSWFSPPPQPNDFSAATRFSMRAFSRRDFIGFRVVLPIE